MRVESAQEAFAAVRGKLDAAVVPATVAEAHPFDVSSGCASSAVLAVWH